MAAVLVWPSVAPHLVSLLRNKTTEAGLTAMREELGRANGRADRAEQARDAERNRADGLQAELLTDKEARAKAEGVLQEQTNETHQQLRELLERKPTPEEAAATLRAQGRLILALPRWLRRR